MSPNQPNSAISLSHLNAIVSKVIDVNFTDGIWTIAEISALQERGHCYLELIEKDTDTDTIIAKASANIWRNVYVKLRMEFARVTGMQLAVGMKVLVKAKPTFHPQYGFSLNITDIDPSYTMGDAALKRAAVVRRLKEEGIYDLNKELQLPALIKRIAVISASGAAGYGDFMNQLTNNPNGYKYCVTLFEAVMQGDSAELSIIAALDKIASRVDDFDIVVIVRGGGAVSDLSCYDKYDLCSAVAQFPLPVLSGIGHERDISVVDEVVCVRLKTPTAVAAFIIESTYSQEMQLKNIAQSLGECVRLCINQNNSRLELLGSSINGEVKVCIERHKNSVATLCSYIPIFTNAYFEAKGHYLDMALQTVELTSPKNVLKKGYSMTQAGGRVVTSVKGLKEGDIMTTIFADGSINSIIK